MAYCATCGSDIDQRLVCCPKCGATRDMMLVASPFVLFGAVAVGIVTIVIAIFF